MAIDPYSYCPHGSGKKLKFCCPKLIHEFEKIDRMGSADQMLALEQHLERTLKTHPTNPCLLGDLALVRIDQEKFDAASEVVNTMLQHHPENPSALGLQAVLLLKEEQLRDGIAQLQNAFSASTTVLPTSIGYACFEAGQLAFFQNEAIVASAHLQATLVMNHQAEYAQHYLHQLLSSTEVPLVLKAEFSWDDYTGEAPWKEAFNEAMQVARSLRWQEMIDKLFPLVEQYPDEPLLWERLAWTQAALAQQDFAAESFRRLAACEAANRDDRIEAAAVAENLGVRKEDKADMVRRTYQVEDYDALHTNLLSDRHLSSREVERERWASREEIPPLAQFNLLNRPKIKEDSPDLTVDQLPNIIGDLRLFGKSTEQEARLEWVFYSGDLFDEAEALLRRVAGSPLGEMLKEEVVDSLPREAMALTVRVLPPEDGVPQRLNEIYQECRKKAILEKWPQLRLERFGKQTAVEAASDPFYQILVSGAVLNLETAYAGTFGLEMFDQLREQLQLPKLPPVELGDTSAALVPISRVPRLELANLDDESLETLFQRSLSVAYKPAIKAVAREVLQRDRLVEKIGPQFLYEQLLASTTTLEEAQEYLQQAREATKEILPSDATWDLAEFGLLLDYGFPERAGEVLNAIVRDHHREPDTMQTVQQILIQFGMLNPDGSMRESPMPEEAPQESAAEGGLWTPGQPSGAAGPPPPQSEKSGGLWLPGME